MTMQKELALASYVKSVRFVSKDEAAKELTQQLEEDLFLFWATIHCKRPSICACMPNMSPRALIRIENDLDALEYVDYVLYASRCLP